MPETQSEPWDWRGISRTLDRTVEMPEPLSELSRSPDEHQLYGVNYVPHEYETKCSICVDDTLNTCNLNCGHEFHYECMVQWCMVSPTCPLCRVHVDVISKNFN